ncbi:MAG: sterol desaturase family protein [Solirubrobacteraceae bacterium]
MNETIHYFEAISSKQRSILLFGGIAFFWIVESGIPLFKFQYNKLQHAFLNFFFTLTTVIVNFLLAFILFKVLVWTNENNFGLLHWLQINNLWLKAIIGLLLLDLIGAYSAHYVEHKTKALWRFHLIHHTDTFIDTTTANRHHPGESVIRFVFTTIGIFIVGAPVWLFFMYQSFSVLLSQFNHANIKMPKNVDKWLSYIVVSPDMHKVHHHYMLPYTDSNYGNIFSFWDRLFGTFLVLPREAIIYGVDTHMHSDENNKLLNLLKIPFQKYRNPQL